MKDGAYCKVYSRRSAPALLEAVFWLTGRMIVYTLSISQQEDSFH